VGVGHPAVVPIEPLVDSVMVPITKGHNILQRLTTEGEVCAVMELITPRRTNRTNLGEIRISIPNFELLPVIGVKVIGIRREAEGGQSFCKSHVDRVV